MDSPHRDILIPPTLSSSPSKPIQQRILRCSLEDLYLGSTRKIDISRPVTINERIVPMTEEIHTIEIKPGMKKGTKISSLEKGPTEVVFIIDEIAHILFDRENNDLIVTTEISLVQALRGFIAKLTTLDGRIMSVPVNSIVSPTYEETVEGEGMPIPEKPTNRGNLRIKFIIKYPEQVTPQQKMEIKRLLVLDGVDMWGVISILVTTSIEQIPTIEIMSGWTEGTTFTSPENGNEQGIIPSNRVFTINGKPHSVFKGDNYDLIITLRITLVQALTGFAINFTTFNGRSLMVPINFVVIPSYEEVVEGEGMTIQNEPTQRGNLRIKFDIKFPSKLTPEQKTGFKRIFLFDAMDMSDVVHICAEGGCGTMRHLRWLLHWVNCFQ